MLCGLLRESVERGHALQDVPRPAWMLPNFAELFVGEFGWLVQSSIRDTELADVVEQTGAEDDPAQVGIGPHRRRDADRIARHIQRMPRGERHLGVGGEGVRNAVEPLVGRMQRDVTTSVDTSNPAIDVHRKTGHHAERIEAG